MLYTGTCACTHIYLSNYTSFYMSIYLSIYLSVYLPIYAYTYVSYLYIHTYPNAPTPSPSLESRFLRTSSKSNSGQVGSYGPTQGQGEGSFPAPSNYPGISHRYHQVEEDYSGSVCGVAGVVCVVSSCKVEFARLSGVPSTPYSSEVQVPGHSAPINKHTRVGARSLWPKGSFK